MSDASTDPLRFTEDEIDELINERLIATGTVHLVGTPMVKAMRKRIKRTTFDELVNKGVAALEKEAAK